MGTELFSRNIALFYSFSFKYGEPKLIKIEPPLLSEFKIVIILIYDRRGG